MEPSNIITYGRKVASICNACLNGELQSSHLVMEVIPAWEPRRRDIRQGILTSVFAIHWCLHIGAKCAASMPPCCIEAAQVIGLRWQSLVGWMASSPILGSHSLLQIVVLVPEVHFAMQVDFLSAVMLCDRWERHNLEPVHWGDHTHNMRICILHAWSKIKCGMAPLNYMRILLVVFFLSETVA